MEPEPLVDTETLGRVADRRGRAGFEESYVAEVSHLVALARSLAGPAVAEDIAQEAMLVAFRRWREVGDLERDPTCGFDARAPTWRSPSSGAVWPS